MGDLKENLSTISSVLPSLRSGVQELVAGGQALEKAASELLASIAEKDEQAAEMVAQVEQALARAAEANEGERAEIEGVVAGIASHLERGLEDARNGLSAVDEAVVAAGGATGHLAASLADAGRAAEEAVAPARQQLAELGEAARAGGGRVQEAHHEAAQAVEGLRAEVEAAVGSLDAVEALDRRLQELMAHAAERTQATLARLEELRAAHEAELGEQSGALAEGREALLAEVRERLETGLVRLLDAAAEPACAALAEVEREGIEAVASCSAGRGRLDELFGRLRETTRPLRPAIDSVKEAADQVGLAWG
jgi:chromosome segregation ATPase